MATSRHAIAAIVGTLAVTLLGANAARADEPIGEVIPYQCVDSVVTERGTYFENDPSSGFYVGFKTRVGVEKFPEAHAAIVDRGAEPGSVIARQKVGDRVQVCLVSQPKKDEYCDPSKDSRGRIYRVYNYRLKAAFDGMNANHYCGGA